MNKQLTKYDDKLKDLEENIRFYLSTPEKFAEALVFSKKLKKFAEEIETKVKTRGSEIMNDRDLKEIEFGDFKVIKIDPTITITYRVSQVMKVFGENAEQFLKVDGTKLKNYILKARIEGEDLETLNIGRKESAKKGYIRLISIDKS
jgi:hypothetical protein